MDTIKSYDPDLVILGPAFNAGRYGMACGKIGATVMEELDILLLLVYTKKPRN